MKTLKKFLQEKENSNRILKSRDMLHIHGGDAPLRNRNSDFGDPE